MKITTGGRRAGACLAALLPLSLWAALQDEPRVESESTRRSRFSADAVREDMQGVWRLERLVASDREIPQDPEVGYMLVSGSYFSLEIHGDWYMENARIVDLREPTKTENVLTGTTQTGIHRFEIDSAGTMKTSSLIGTAYLADGAYEFEAPGTEREYRVHVAGDFMRLTAFEGRELTFRRVSHGAQERDIYGRLRSPTPSATPGGEAESEYELDADGEVKRDIYGRPIRKKSDE
jgi:hypothetical protein